jgi:SAM-dependent methyltransferase
MIRKSRLFVEGLGMPLVGIRRKAINELNELVYTGRIKIKEVNECFCKHSNFELLSRYDRYGLPFGTQICRNCGLISQTIGLEENSMALFYNKIYWPMSTGTEDPNLHYTTSSSPYAFIKFLKPEVKYESRKITVFEVGCGNGIRLEHIQKAFGDKYKIQLLGCDYSDNSLNIAKGKGIEVMRGSMETLLEKAPADILILSHVFEHFVDVFQALEFIDKLTHDNSLVYVELPGVVDLKNKPEYMYDYQIYTVLAHVHNFSLTTLAGVFSAQGFKLVKGTEYVRAIFRKNVEKPQSISANPYEEIMGALWEAREKHLDHIMISSNPLKKYVKGVAKALLGKL